MNDQQRLQLPMKCTQQHTNHHWLLSLGTFIVLGGALFCSNHIDLHLFFRLAPPVYASPIDVPLPPAIGRSIATAGKRTSLTLQQGNHVANEQLGEVVALSAGFQHACAVDSAGLVWCWGYNGTGQLGDGTALDRASAVPVQGLAAQAITVAAGQYHSCALLVNGVVQCWHQISSRQSSAPGNIVETTPVTITGISGTVTAIAGGNNTCVLTDTGAIYCWSWGQLVATPKAGITEKIRAVASGYEHVCALTEGGGVLCWGWNYTGQLGDGTGTDSGTPVQVQGLDHGVVAINAGEDTTCALTDKGAVLCWGANTDGQLGDGATFPSLEPIAVMGLDESVVELAVGLSHSCVRTTTDKVYCWGDNRFGQAGGGDPTREMTPVVLDELTGMVRELVAGAGFTCARTIAGAVSCWGQNDFGQLGDGSILHVPKAVSALESEVSALAVGFLHTCALTKTKAIFCWGMNDHNQLGDGTEINRSRPVRVKGAQHQFTAIAVGGFHTCALAEEHELFCWGKNDKGQLGNGSFVGFPYPIDVSPKPNNPPFVQIAAGFAHTCAITDAGELYCWGDNIYGQLGDGTTETRLSPTKVINLNETVTAVSTTGNHTCALTSEGALYCWGANSKGQLGDGTRISRTSPIAVSQFDASVQAISASSAHTCALLTGGDVFCWGGNSDGQVGDGTLIDRTTPVAVLGLNEAVTLIGTGSNHSCAWLVSSRLACWGNNKQGQLGNGTAFDYIAPTVVQPFTGALTAVGGGIDHSCALATHGSVFCWGSSWLGRVAHAPNWPPTNVVKALPIPKTYLPLILHTS